MKQLRYGRVIVSVGKGLSSSVSQARPTVGKVSRFTGTSEMPRGTSPICTASISIIGLRRFERPRRMLERNEPLPAHFLSLGVLVASLSDLK